MGCCSSGASPKAQEALEVQGTPPSIGIPSSLRGSKIVTDDTDPLMVSGEGAALAVSVAVRKVPPVPPSSPPARIRSPITAGAITRRLNSRDDLLPARQIGALTLVIHVFCGNIASLECLR